MSLVATPKLLAGQLKCGFAESGRKSDNCFGFGDTDVCRGNAFGNDSALIGFLTDQEHRQLGPGIDCDSSFLCGDQMECQRPGPPSSIN